MSDSYAYLRERPARLGRNPSPRALDAVARYLSARIAQILNFHELDVSDLAISLVNPNYEEAWAGLRPNVGYRAIPKRTPWPDTRAGIAPPEEILINKRMAQVFDMTPTLAHEIAHHYLGAGTDAVYNRDLVADSVWIHEAYAEYVTDLMGLGEPQEGEPTEGYQKGAGFLFFVEAMHPGVAEKWASWIRGGQDPATGFQFLTGENLDDVLDFYRTQQVYGGKDIDRVGTLMGEQQSLVGLLSGLFPWFERRSRLGPLSQKALNRQIRRSVASRVTSRRWQAWIGGRTKFGKETTGMEGSDNITPTEMRAAGASDRPPIDAELTPRRPPAASALRRRAAQTPASSTDRRLR